jgi:hypothetical protein
MKVETIIEKLPKDSGSPLNKNDVKMIAREQLQELLNSNDDKVIKSKMYTDLSEEIAKLRK